MNVPHMVAPEKPSRGFPSRFDTECFACPVRIRVGDLVLRSNNLFESDERGIFIEGPFLLQAYHSGLGVRKYHIKWAVREIINGPGRHDDGIRDGDVTVVASGQVDKDSDSEATLRVELTAALEKSFPAQGIGPTYDIDRVYDIEITEIA